MNNDKIYVVSNDNIPDTEDQITEDMIIILRFLYRRRRFKTDKSFPQKKLISILQHKIKGDIIQVIKDLVNRGLMGQIQKQGKIRHWVKRGTVMIILNE